MTRTRLVIFSLLATLVVSSAYAGDVSAKTVDCTQLTAWLIGGVPSNRLSQLGERRGVGLRC